ncbi:LCP family protein [Schaalia sp. 19OD2882]|uniref:LCP family protein n=1 Tax=Schaalia sp. 19OD2882 TaxID=2794089 RepID=UPI001C1F0CF6|nr:LCP family protein [Schaalia sp. 19OD2882]QWW20257.1 LCP family protein [Schaalia sp. 19OD2882]
MSSHPDSARAHALHSATEPRRLAPLRAALVALLSVVTFVGAGAGATWLDLSARVRANVLGGDSLTASQSGVGYKVLPPADSFKGRALNILVSGIDSRYDQGALAYGDTDEHVVIHSDTTMLLHMSADRSHVEVVSIPRDLITEVPECIASDGTKTESFEGMFNSAFAYAAVTTDITAGVLCTKATVEHLTGLDIDGYVVVDFKGFQAMVNALGGVWYDVEEDIDDEDADLHLSAGCQKLDGVTALGFARVRKSVGDGSDTGRIGRQQKLVSAMMREVLSKNFVTELPEVLSFVRATLASLYTSPNLSSLETDAGLLLSIASIDHSRITFTTMPTYPAPWDSNRVLEDEVMADQLWAALADDRPIPSGFTVTNGNGNTGVLTEVTQDSGQSATTLVEQPASDSAEGTGPTGEAATEGAHANPGTAPEELPAASLTEAAPTPAPAPPTTCPPRS